MKMMIDIYRSKGDAYLKTLDISEPEDDMDFNLGPLTSVVNSCLSLITLQGSWITFTTSLF